MTSEQLQEIGSALTAFLRTFEQFFDNPQGVVHLRNYSRGLLSDLERKAAEPLALFSGVPVRNVRQFLKACVWDDRGLVDAVQQHLREEAVRRPDDGLGTVAVSDETSAVKEGDNTPGVQRQYLGCLGKIENGIVTVHLAAVKNGFKTLLDGELFLPKSWDEDRDGHAHLADYQCISHPGHGFVRMFCRDHAAENSYDQYVPKSIASEITRLTGVEDEYPPLGVSTYLNGFQDAMAVIRVQQKQIEAVREALRLFKDNLLPHSNDPEDDLSVPTEELLTNGYCLAEEVLAATDPNQELPV